MKTIQYDPAAIKFMPSLPRYEPFFQDHSATIVAKACYRKYFYRIVCGRVPPVSKWQVIFDFGSAYHKFRELLETDGYDKAIAYVMKAKLHVPEPGNKFAFLDRLRLLKTCQEAYEHWQREKDNGRIKVIATEQPFNVLLNPENDEKDHIYISGRADQIIELNGRLWDRDFKTTSKDQMMFTRQTDPNDQAMRYIAGLSILHGKMVQGAMFEAIYNTKTIGPKIYTILSSRTEKQIEQWKKEQVVLNRQLQICRDTDTWPMQEVGCSFCDYAKVCRGSSVEAQEATLKADYKFEPWDSSKVNQSED